MRVPVCVNPVMLISTFILNGRVNAHIFQLYQANLKRWPQGSRQC